MHSVVVVIVVLTYVGCIWLCTTNVLYQMHATTFCSTNSQQQPTTVSTLILTRIVGITAIFFYFTLLAEISQEMLFMVGDVLTIDLQSL